MTRREWIALAVLLALAAIVRLRRIDETLFWFDEAESTVNALTILEHGIPVDHHLGRPLYENTLLRPWSESAEFEFKDSSYSERGVATYHGWLPLYAIAASLRIAGIEPDRAGRPLVAHDDPERDRRLTVAARAPSLLFGLALLLVLFTAARELHGKAAGFATLTLATFETHLVRFSCEARYFALALLLAALAGLCTWRVRFRGERRDYAALALVLALLFHTHLIAFATAVVVLALQLPATLPRARAGARHVGLVAFLAAAILPPAIATGWFETAALLPRAWPLLELPGDVLRFPLQRPWLVAAIGVAAAAIATCALLRRRLPARLAAAVVPRLPAFAFLGGWILAGFALFHGLTPAVSHVVDRMTAPILVPLLLAGGAVAAALSELATRRWAAALASALGLALVAAAPSLRESTQPRQEARSERTRSALAWLRGRELAPGTLLYATPNHHLILAAYSGLPVTSVAPVRREFLDRHDGPVLVFDCVDVYTLPPAAEVEAAAAAAGLAPDEPRVSGWQQDLREHAIDRRARALCAEVVRTTPLPEIPEPIAALVERVPEWTARTLARDRDELDFCPSVFRGFTLHDAGDWWPIYFYRFVSPRQRMGDAINYRGRVADGRVTVLPGGWLVFESDAPSAAAPR